MAWLVVPEGSVQLLLFLAASCLYLRSQVTATDHFMSTGHLLLINAQFEAYGKWLCVNGTSKMWRNLLIVWATDFDLAFNMCDSVV